MPPTIAVCLMQNVCALRVDLTVWTAMQAMFNPPDPLEFKEPVSKRKSPSVDGISAILASKPGLFEMGPPPPKEEFETPRQRHARIAAAKREVKLSNSGRTACFLVILAQGSNPYVTRMFVRVYVCLGAAAGSCTSGSIVSVTEGLGLGVARSDARYTSRKKRCLRSKYCWGATMREMDDANQIRSLVDDRAPKHTRS